MGERALVITVLGALMLTAPATLPALGSPASAVELSLADTTLVLSGTPRDERLTASADGEGVIFTADVALALDETVEKTCARRTPRAARCETAGLALIVLDGGAGDDAIHSDTGAGPPVELRGGEGRDVLVGSAADEAFDAGNGDDDVTTGGGSDVVDLGRGTDHLDAHDAGRDVLTCGPGGATTGIRDADDIVDGTCAGLLVAPGTPPPPSSPPAVAGAGDDAPPPPPPPAAEPPEDGEPATSAPPAAPSATVMPPPPDPAPAQRPSGPLPPDAPNLAPHSGTILIRPPGATTFTRVPAATRIRTGTIVDATDGVVELVSNAAGDESMRFSAGMFRVRQSTPPRPIVDVELVGGDLSRCPRTSPGSRDWARERRRTGRLGPSAEPNEPTARTSSRGRVRRLWGRGRKGRFRTVGREGSASVRGTAWLTEDTCFATRVRVTEGEIEARDGRTGSTARIRAGGVVSMPFSVATLRRIARGAPREGQLSRRGRDRLARVPR